jgi:Domain of unknown function (DUF4150)/GHH signature containing HNH/Endo VII superfamily nuclease toxin  2
MANEVYANGREISCKAGSGKSICAFPDVCMTPPENPATPPGVPVPYPNTGMDPDTTEGSRSVTISGQEVMLKNKSCFKTSTGDEAGCATKKGVITSTNKGKVYFIAWSMDVKIEGENVDRHLDMTTHNHASPIANEAAPMTYVYAAAMDSWTCEQFKQECADACKDAPQVSVVQSPSMNGKRDFHGGAVGEEALRALRERAKNECPGQTMEVVPVGRDCSKHPKCAELQKCVLKPKNADKTFCCKPSTTGHHMIPGHSFAGVSGYVYENAPCVCVQGQNQHQGNHGKMHDYQDYIEKCRIKLFETGFLQPGRYTSAKPWSYKDVRETALDAHAQVFKGAGCKRECLAKELDDFHKGLIGGDESTPMSAHDAFGAKPNPERVDRSRTSFQQNIADKGFSHVLSF